jgi:hypothetical protein
MTSAIERQPGSTVCATAQVALRAPVPYAQLCHQLAAALGVTAGTLLRRAVEHYAQSVAAAEIGSELPDQLIAEGRGIRNLPRAKERSGAPVLTLDS